MCGCFVVCASCWQYAKPSILFGPAQLGCCLKLGLEQCQSVAIGLVLLLWPLLLAHLGEPTSPDAEGCTAVLHIWQYAKATYAPMLTLQCMEVFESLGLFSGMHSSGVALLCAPIATHSMWSCSLWWFRRLCYILGRCGANCVFVRT